MSKRLTLRKALQWQCLDRYLKLEVLLRSLNHGVAFYKTDKAQKVDRHFIGPVAENKIVVMHSAEGVGWGKPSERDARLATRDVKDAIVSPRAAREDYVWRWIIRRET